VFSSLQHLSPVFNETRPERVLEAHRLDRSILSSMSRLQLIQHHARLTQQLADRERLQGSSLANQLHQRHAARIDAHGSVATVDDFGALIHRLIPSGPYS
jgi:hypothetical protein